MNTREAIKAIYAGKKVALPEFGGYWYLGQDGGIMVHSKDDKITKTPWFGKYGDRTDWEVVEGKRTPTKPIGQLMSFGNAINALEAGYCVQRKGWNGKGLFVCKQIPAKIEGLIIDKIQSLPTSCKELLKEREGVPHIDYTNQMLIINPDGRADSWVPSSSDVFAKDWIIVK